MEQVWVALHSELFSVVCSSIEKKFIQVLCMECDSLGRHCTQPAQLGEMHCGASADLHSAFPKHCGALKNLAEKALLPLQKVSAQGEQSSCHALGSGAENGLVQCLCVTVVCSTPTLMGAHTVATNGVVFQTLLFTFKMMKLSSHSY